MDVILNFLNTTWESIGAATPVPYDAFHLVCFALAIISGIVLCFLWKHEFIFTPRYVAMGGSIVIFAFDLYEQFIHSFTVVDGVLAFEYHWECFPWQFYATPMIIGVLAAITKGKIYEHFMSYLATYSLAAGALTMFFPVYSETIGLCVQSMINGGVMIALGIFLYYSGAVKIEHYTIIKSLPIFVLNVCSAISLNFLANLLQLNGFNAFYLNPMYDNDLFLFGDIHSFLRVWEYPFGYILSALIYVIGFTGIAYVALLAVIGIKKLFDTDFDAEYAEEDAKALAKKNKKKDDDDDNDDDSDDQVEEEIEEEVEEYSI